MPTLLQNRLAAHTSSVIFESQLLATSGTKPAAVRLPGSRGHHETEEKNRTSGQNSGHVSVCVLLGSNRRVERVHDERQSASQRHAPRNFG